MSTRASIVFVASLALTAAGCLCRGTGTCAESGDGGGDPAAAAQAVFDNNCVVCHAGAGSAAEPDLRAGTLAAQLVNQMPAMCPTADPLVTPGDPDHSYLYQKITQAMPRCGVRMPQGGSPLGSSDVAAIHDWIQSLGASSGDGGP